MVFGNSGPCASLIHFKLPDLRGLDQTERLLNHQLVWLQKFLKYLEKFSVKSI